MFNVSINPVYYCNLRCPWCYLTEDQLSDSSTASLFRIRQRLDELKSNGCEFDVIDIYGGEVALLPKNYQEELLDIVESYSPNKINTITNLTTINAPLVADPRTTLGVSYDFDFRQQHERVWLNMLLVNKDIHLIILAFPELINQMKNEGVGSFIQAINSHYPIASVEIKPYSTNQANRLSSPHTDFEWVVTEWIKSLDSMRFDFINEALVAKSLEGQSNAFSDNHVYINPNGNFAVLEFDENDDEFFLELKSWESYVEWTETERRRIESNVYCGNCEYSGKCLSEHLRQPTSLDSSCNGYRNLLRWHESL